MLWRNILIIAQNEVECKGTGLLLVRMRCDKLWVAKIGKMNIGSRLEETTFL